MLSRILPAAFAALLAFPALAHDGVHIENAYARVAASGSGAVFFDIVNHAAEADRLVAAASDAAARVELHTHVQDAQGVMRMVEVKDGIPVGANETRSLMRGGDHVMLMGLTRPLKDGDVISVTLTFERGEAITVEVPVDNARKAGDGAHGHGHGEQSGHNMHNHHGAPTAVDTAGMADADAIVAVMMAQFDRPEAPLNVGPVTVEGVHALASWAQDDKGGRALLQRRDGQWTIVLCGGADLRLPSFLTQHGVGPAERLAAAFAGAEDAMGSEKVALWSSFEGIVMVGGVHTGH
ncbi:MAG: copper chaperone PCu(A)C [Paracoccaceae bacterium]|nr:MAG: copper chaperone PCu(A)C [Paracoccaceae bacterium]